MTNDKLTKIIENILRKSVLNEAFQVGQRIAYNGKQYTIIQVYLAPPNNAQTLDVKLPVDTKLYPVYVLQSIDGKNSISVVTQNGINNLKAII